MSEERLLHVLYHTVPGRAVLRLLAGRGLSRLCGAFLDSPLSRPLIPGFVARAGIRLEDYEPEEYRCFNDCFTRRIRPELRPVPASPTDLMSPCDGLLTVYPVTEGLVLPIKQSAYRVSDLLGGDPEWERFRDGVCLVFRLCVEHYHRYCYFDDGTKGPNVFLPGKLHTVRPVALEARPVFTENCREYTFLDTEHFGRAAQIEVGAMLVGKIRNHHGSGPVARGQEKGMFLYGGSTVVVLLEPGRAELEEEILRASQRGEETPVLQGQRLGTAVR